MLIRNENARGDFFWLKIIEFLALMHKVFNVAVVNVAIGIEPRLIT